MQLLNKTLTNALLVLGLSFGLMVSHAADFNWSSKDPAVQKENKIKLKKEAELGDPYYQFMLGIQYEEGVPPVKKNDAIALHWYQKAAFQDLNNVAYSWSQISAEVGITGSQEKLGLMFAEGRGVRQSYPEAAKWYKEAADNGSPSAQYQLGLMYENGQGVRQSYPEAVDLYSKAAKKSYPLAQNKLGLMYENGQGVRQSHVLAKEWYGKSCDNGHQTGCDNYKRLNK